MLAAVLLSAGIWSWLWSTVWLDPRLGSWMDTGTVAQIDGDPTHIAYVNLGQSGVDYTLVGNEFDSQPQVEEGDHVMLTVANISDPHSAVYDWRIIKLQSRRGTWTAKDYSYQAAAAVAALHPGLGLNYETVRWAASLVGVLLSLVVLLIVHARLAVEPSGQEPRRVVESLRREATDTRFSDSDRIVLGCAVAMAIGVITATLLVSWWLHAAASVFVPP